MDGRKKWVALALTLGLAMAREAPPKAAQSSEPAAITMEDWLVVGPFPAGSREGLIDDLMEWGGVDKIQPREGMEHSSFYAKNGTVRWKKVKSKDGAVELSNPDVDWDALENQWGAAGGISAWFGYAEYTAAEEQRVLISAEKIGAFYINRERYFGDPYGHGYVQAPAVLYKGLNRILVRVGGGGPTAFTFKTVPASAPVIVNAKDALVPDLIVGESLDSWAAIPVVNTTTETMRNVKLEFGGHGPFEKTVAVVQELAPLSIQEMSFAVKTTRAISEDDETDKDRVSASVSVGGGRDSDTAAVSFRMRKPGQSFRLTFRSKTDLSVQKYAVLPPTPFDLAKRYALVVTLHGAGVDADGQVDAYTPKDWAIIIAPTNTRPFGFDWQDWGRLNMLETIEQAKARFAIDENRVYLTGHSMGGHGTWYNALNSPDHFAAFGPSAGWTSFPYYVPFTLRKGSLYSPPGLQTIWERALRADNVPLFVENAHTLPAYLIHGEKDDNVPPFHARWMVGLMHDLGQEAIYYERPGAGHWWDDPKTPGADCVNWPELFDFFKAQTRDPYPKDVILRTNDIALNDHAYWVKIDEMEIPYEDARVEARVTGPATLKVETQNVEEFSLFPKGILTPGDICVFIQGSVICLNWDGESPIAFHKQGVGFYPGPRESPGLHKSANLFGPMKRAYFSPFIFVYGTTGGDEMTHINQRAAVVDAQTWWWRANGYVRVIADTEVTDEIARDYNLILYGGPETNAVTKEIQDRLPIKVEGAGVRLRGSRSEGGGLAARFVYPNPDQPDHLVLVIAGTDAEGMKLAAQAGLFTSGAGYPDYIVFDESVKTKGWGGFRAAGFFDNHWRPSSDPRLAYSQ
ncbi:MAG: S-layer protein [bacterium]